LREGRVAGMAIDQLVLVLSSACLQAEAAAAAGKLHSRTSPPALSPERRKPLAWQTSWPQAQVHNKAAPSPLNLDAAENLLPQGQYSLALCAASHSAWASHCARL